MVNLSGIIQEGRASKTTVVRLQQRGAEKILGREVTSLFTLSKRQPVFKTYTYFDRYRCHKYMLMNNSILALLYVEE